ncbi:hypothetical protein PROFUN_10829 [Planoprotostelium fungivorum]|uniref:Spatacsin C-terminal domain-containing protein n=1 Tax=Planoprotostelium fungivorum TaxID=1890364 RepID=A0A2P6NCP3_9EUKA|nr:hypothetical protein PROFUN_10829 [Planoprotostelium fungivorum]
MDIVPSSSLGLTSPLLSRRNGSPPRSSFAPSFRNSFLSPRRNVQISDTQDGGLKKQPIQTMEVMLRRFNGDCGQLLGNRSQAGVFHLVRVTINLTLCERSPSVSSGFIRQSRSNSQPMSLSNREYLYHESEVQLRGFTLSNVKHLRLPNQSITPSTTLRHRQHYLTFQTVMRQLKIQFSNDHTDVDVLSHKIDRDLLVEVMRARMGNGKPTGNSLELLGISGTQMILVVDTCFICVLEMSATGLELNSFFSIEISSDSKPIQTVTLSSGWLFAMDTESYVRILLDICYQEEVERGQPADLDEEDMTLGSPFGARLSLSQEIEASRCPISFSRLGVSLDLLTIVCGNDKGQLVSIHLDQYFETVGSARQEEGTLVHWYESGKNLRPVDAYGRLGWLTQRGETGKLEPKNLSGFQARQAGGSSGSLGGISSFTRTNSSYTPSLSSSVPFEISSLQRTPMKESVGRETSAPPSPILRKTSLGFPLSQLPSSKTLRASSSIVRTKYRAASDEWTLIDVHVCTHYIVCIFMTLDGQQKMSLCDHSLRSHTSERDINDKDVTPVILQDQSLLLFQEAGLSTILMGVDINQDRILNNLISSEKTEMAEQLCLLNRWDKSTLRLHALDMGLRMRQMNVIEGSLSSLVGEQRLVGAQMLVDYISNEELHVHQKAFITNIIDTAISSLSSMISERAESMSEEKEIRIAMHEPLQSLDSTVSQIFALSTVIHSMRQTNEKGEREKERKLKPRRLFEENQETLIVPEEMKTWTKKDEVTIIEEALLDGKVSLALGYLQRRYHDGQDVGSVPAQNLSWNSMYIIASLLVYRAIVQQQPAKIFKEISTKTTRSDVRESLTTLLQRMNVPFSSEESDAIDYLSRLEKLYEDSRQRVVDETPEDIDSNACSSLGITVNVKEISPRHNAVHVPSQGNDHVTLSLDWIISMTTETRHQILLDRKCKEGTSLLSQVKYHTSRGNLKEISEILEGTSFNGLGEVSDQSGAFEMFAEVSQGSGDIVELWEGMPDILSCCTTIMRSHLLNVFAVKGVLLNETNVQPLVPSNAQYVFPLGTSAETRRNFLLLGRLAYNRLLFLEDSTRETLGTLNQLLPLGRLSNFHRFFLQFCIDHDLKVIFVEYCNTYHLQLAAEDTSLLRVDKAWANEMIRVRGRYQLEKASAINAAILLGSTSSSPLSLMLRSSRSVMALGHMVVKWSEGEGPATQSTVHKILKEEGSSESQIVREISVDFPFLSEILFPPIRSGTPTAGRIRGLRMRDMISYRGDIKLSDMISSFSSFDINTLFGPPSTTSRPVVDEEFIQCIPSFDRVVDGRMTDQMDIYYWIYRGQPFQAYHYLLQHGKSNLGDVFRGSGVIQIHLHERPAVPTDLRIDISENIPDRSRDPAEDLSFDEREQAYIEWYVRTVCTAHFRKKNVILAGIVFLELCGISAERLKVEIRAANIIYQCRISDLQRDRITEEESITVHVQLVRDFIQFDPRGNLVRDLERGTEELCTRMTEDDVINVRARWDLVAKLCEWRNVPKLGTHLRHLSLASDWIHLLYEAQSQSFEPEQVLQIVRSTVESQDLKDHLDFVLRKMSTSQRKISNGKEGSRHQDVLPPTDAEIYRIFLSVRKFSDPSLGFLRCAVASCRSILAVIAHNFSQYTNLESVVKPMDCAIVWCVLNGKEKSHRKLLENLSNDTSDFTSFTNEDFETLNVSMATTGDGMGTAVLHRMYLIFDCENPFGDFLDFHLRVQASDWYAAEKMARSFVSRMNENNRYTFGDPDMLWRMTSSIMEKHMKRTGNFYEMKHLLDYCEILKIFPERLKEMRRSLSVLEKNCMHEKLGETIFQEPREIIRQLMDSGHVTDARQYSQDNGVVSNEITMVEIRKLLHESMGTNDWSDEEFRTKIWKQCNQMFVDRSAEGKAVGDFFYNESQRENSMTIPEKILLLSLAQNWYSGHGCTVSNNRMQPAALLALKSSPKIPSDKEPVEKKENSMHYNLENEILYWTTKLELETVDSMTSSQKHKVLDVIVGRFLESGNLTRAERICSQYNYECLDLKLLKSLLELIEDNIKISQLSDDIMKIAQRNISMVKFSGASTQPNSSVDISKTRTIEVMEALRIGMDNPASKKWADRIIINYKVSICLRIPYKTVITRDPYELLSTLLHNGKEIYSIARGFIHYNELVYSAVAVIIGESFYRTVLEHSHSSSTDFEIPTDVEFLELVNLSRSPKDVGVKLLNLYCGHETLDGPGISELSLSSQGEVEVLIKSYLCFQIAGNTIGSSMVLSIVKSRAQDYADRDEFHLLFRFLTGLGCYSKLHFIFSLMIRYDRFELLLQKRNSEDVNLLSMRAALQGYLQLHHPEDTEKLQMMFLRFHMYRDIGQLTENQAFVKLNSIRAKTTMTPQLLSEIMQLFLDAANSYMKDKCYKAATRCMSLAELVGMQISSPDVRLLNLTEAEVTHLMTYRGQFRETFILSRAYDRVEYTDWVGPIWQQCINNNFRFLEEYLCTFTPLPELFRDIAKMYKMDSHRNSHTNNFKKFLKYVNDKVLRFEIARECELDDICAELMEKVPSIRLALALSSAPSTPLGIKHSPLATFPHRC